MLTGGVGIGFWVWDEWNNLRSSIIIAIFVVSVVGLLLEQLLLIARRFSYGSTTSYTMNAIVKVENVGMAFETRRALRRPEGCQSADPQWRSGVADRPLGLRQIHPAQPDRRPDPALRSCVQWPRDPPAPAGSGRCSRTTPCCPGWSCFENVYLAVGRSSAPKEGKARLKERTAAALEMVPDPRGAEDAHEISGGMKQRIRIAGPSPWSPGSC